MSNDDREYHEAVVRNRRTNVNTTIVTCSVRSSDESDFIKMRHMKYHAPNPKSLCLRFHGMIHFFC
jgi:hypothetical protein